MQKDTQPSQACSGGHIKPKLTKIDAGEWATLAQDRTEWARLITRKRPH